MNSSFKEILLGDICIPKQWKTLDKTQLLKNGYPVYGANGKIGYYSTFNHQDEVIAITCRGATCGNITLTEPYSYVTGNSMCLEELSNEIDIRFLYYYLLQKGLKKLVSGSAQPQITRFPLQQISIHLPPLPEQKKIAEILSVIDKTINATIAEKNYIELIRKSIIKQLTIGINFKGIRKNSGTEYGMIPAHWNCEPITECCKLENNKRKPINADDRKQMRGQYPYHGATKIQDYISEYSFEGDYTLIGEDGDHFSKYDSWEMAQYASGRFNVSNHAHVIGSTSKCSSKWLYYSMLHRDLTLYLTRQGATRFKLSKASLGEVPVLFPPMDEQLKMIKILDKISNLINALEKKVTKLSILKKGISYELLSGRKRVNV